MEELILVFLEKIVEAIYFAMFLIIGKNIKNKKLLFIGIMVFEYLMLKHFIRYSVYFQLAYTFMAYVNLKVLYKEKAQITDIFLFMGASLILIATSFISYIPFYIFTNGNVQIKEYLAIIFINRTLIFSILICAKELIRSIYKKFCSLWNRHAIPNQIKSLTLRNISIVTFNLMFWLINLGMTFALVNGR
jgi:hypothetical protein